MEFVSRRHKTESDQAHIDSCQFTEEHINLHHETIINKMQTVENLWDKQPVSSINLSPG